MILMSSSLKSKTAAFIESESGKYISLKVFWFSFVFYYGGSDFRVFQQITNKKKKRGFYLTHLGIILFVGNLLCLLRHNLPVH